MFVRTRLVLQLLVSAIVSAAPFEDKSITPTPPTEDPFYQFSDGIDHYAPGAILRSRPPPSPIAAFGVLPVNLKKAHQILYKTTNTFNQSIATVLTVLVPHDADFNKVLSYQVAEDAAFANCGPSYALQLASATSGPLGTIITQAELLLMEAALEQGWVVVVPDHEGPRGAFLANKLAGHAVLDGLRAATGSGELTEIRPDANLALWGYSGGSVASSFAAEMQSSYAPELKIVGAAIGGTVPFIRKALGVLNKGPAAGLIPPGILGLCHEYPELAKVVDQHILPQYRDSFYKAEKQCFGADALAFPFIDVFAITDDPSIYDSEPALSILNENSLGNAIPTIPLFIYKSILDETSLVEDTDQIVKSYCSKGVSITYQRDLASEHGILAVTGAPDALLWLRAALDGNKPRAGCNTKSVISSLLDPKAGKVLSAVLLGALLDLIGKPVGPVFFG